jgi:hypothetical protein
MSEALGSIHSTTENKTPRRLIYIRYMGLSGTVQGWGLKMMKKTGCIIKSHGKECILS